MKRQRSLFAALVLVAAALVAAPRTAQASVAVSISVFHDDLVPYGRWVGVGSYGSCFVPRVAAGWAPYVDGQWVYTDYGWTWVSNDPFGDVPFHYGSWTWADPYGWVWVPGTVWAPAWVTWAYGDDYVGWAPVPPSFGLAVTGYAGAAVVLPATRYVFVPTRQFVGVPVATVRLPAERNSVIFARTVKTTDYRVSGGVVRMAGPPAARIERVAGTKIAPVSIDRVKARPTTITDAGAAQAGKIRVVAPASETRKLAAEGGSAAAAPKEARGKAAPKEPATTATHGHEAAPPPQTAQHGTKNEKAPATTQKREKKAPPPKAPEAAPNNPPAAAHERPAEPPRSEPKEEARVAHGQPQPAHPANHPPANKGKPPEKKPEKQPEKQPEQKPQ